jgi:hypothetical protein
MFIKVCIIFLKRINSNQFLKRLTAGTHGSMAPLANHTEQGMALTGEISPMAFGFCFIELDIATAFQHALDKLPI